MTTDGVEEAAILGGDDEDIGGLLAVLGRRFGHLVEVLQVDDPIRLLPLAAVLSLVVVEAALGEDAVPSLPLGDVGEGTAAEFVEVARLLRLHVL